MRSWAERWFVKGLIEMVTGQGPSTRQLVAEVGDVAHDLPVFLTSPLYRRWHRHWGSTAAERAGSMPGDELLRHAQFRATRAITIVAPPQAVWPWLVQVGALRAGWYSNDLLDNLGHPSATVIVPELQHLEVGQWVPMAPSGPPSDRNAFKVHSFEVNQWLLWAKPDSTWALEWNSGRQLKKVSSDSDSTDLPAVAETTSSRPRAEK